MSPFLLSSLDAYVGRMLADAQSLGFLPRHYSRWQHSRTLVFATGGQIRSLCGNLWLAVLKSRHTQCQLAEQELAHDIYSGCGCSDDETVSKREADLSV